MKTIIENMSHSSVHIRSPPVGGVLIRSLVVRSTCMHMQAAELRRQNGNCCLLLLLGVGGFLSARAPRVSATHRGHPFRWYRRLMVAHQLVCALRPRTGTVILLVGVLPWLATRTSVSSTDAGGVGRRGGCAENSCCAQSRTTCRV